jgi:hypothetical protein
MSNDIDSLLEDINEAFETPATQSNANFGNILRFEKGKDYIVRLLPYVEDAKKTIFPFKYHGWASKSTGNYIEFTDPSIVGKPNPIKKYSFELSAKLRERKLDKDHPDMINARNLWTKDAWLFNCYVVDDPSNPENNGTVKILRVGKQIHDDVIYEAWKGDRKDEFGLRIFDLSPKGCNLKIRCTDNGGGYKDYKKSYFMSPSEIEEIGTDSDKIKEIWSQCYDLTEVYPIKEYEDLKKALNVHFIGNDEESFNSIDDDEDFSEIDDMVEESGGKNDEDESDKVESKKTSKKPKKSESKPKKEKPSSDDDELDIEAEIENL